MRGRRELGEKEGQNNQLSRRKTGGFECGALCLMLAHSMTCIIPSRMPCLSAPQALSSNIEGRHLERAGSAAQAAC